MADSLTLGGSIELLGGGVPSEIPVCAGAVFQLVMNPGMDLGAPQPTTDFVATLILAGNRPFGRRSDNREITLPVKITAPDRQTLAAAREVLEQIVDQDRWVMTWTRDPGPGGTPLTMLIDCFRAKPSKPVYDPLIETRGVMRIDLDIPALPFGRSDMQQQIAFSNPAPCLLGPPPPPPMIVIDQFTQIASPQCTQSTQCVIGPLTACWDPDDPDRVGDPGGQHTPFVYGPATLNPPVSFTGLVALQLWFGLGTRYYHALDYHHRIAGLAIAVTLTDSSGNTLSFSRQNLVLPCAPVYSQPVFSRVTIAIPQGDPVFGYGSVVSYQLVITDRQYPVPRCGWVTCYLDHLVAIPVSQNVAPVIRGMVYTLAGLVGTARAPMSLAFQQPPSAGTTTTLTAAGAGSYTVPAGTAWLQVAATGGGGAGASLSGAGSLVGGGGGGGEWAQETGFPASPGQVIPYVIGAGGQPGALPVPGQATVFGPGPSGSLQLTANGGQSAGYDSAQAGAGGTGSNNCMHDDGGAGRTASGGLGGGGGSSAGPYAPGLTPAGTASVLFSGSGYWLCPAGVTEVYAECWGAGGGGGCGTSYTYGAGGGGGEYTAAWVPVSPGTSYPYVSGATGPGGSGGSGGGQSGLAGGQSSFTGDGGAEVIAFGGQGGLGAQYWKSGGGNGGEGGTGQIEYPGGNGGNAYPYTGGGGSSAGPDAPGNRGDNPSGATAPQGGGAGGSGSGIHAQGGSSGTVPGGGGGGTYYAGYAAGNGGGGQVRLTFPIAGAPTNAGGIAVPGGGAGGAGGATPGQAGQPGLAPGGGGGGGNSAGAAAAGAAGAPGQLIITPFASAPVRTLIVHRPPLGAPKMVQPLVSVGGGNDVPNGLTQYPMPQPVAGVNAAFNGTYTVYLIASSWNGTGSRTVTVTVTQYEFNGGPAYSLSTSPVTISPSQVTNGILIAGVLTLPVKAVPADNTAGYYTVSVTSTNTADRFYDVIFLDTMGQSVALSEPDSAGYLVYYIDAPDPDRALGQVLGTYSDRRAAISVMDICLAISGGPMAIEPLDGENQLFAYCADGQAPSIVVTYWPNWFFDRSI